MNGHELLAVLQGRSAGELDRQVQRWSYEHNSWSPMLDDEIGILRESEDSEDDVQTYGDMKD